MHFFPQKNAFIAWEADKDDKVIRFLVVEKKPEDMETSEVKKLSLSTGNCEQGWAELDECQLTCRIFKIFMDYDFIDSSFRHHCLVQCGQIQELKELRKMLVRYVFDNETLENFELRYYGEKI